MAKISPCKRRTGYWFINFNNGKTEKYPLHCIIRERIDFAIPYNESKRTQLLEELRELLKDYTEDLRSYKRIVGFNQNDITETECEIEYILRLIGKITTYRRAI